MSLPPTLPLAPHKVTDPWRAQRHRRAAMDTLSSSDSALVKALPRMEQAATHPSLKQAFRTHLSETKQQVQRLEPIFQLSCAVTALAQRFERPSL